MENKISLLDFTAQVAKKTGIKQSTVKAFLSSLGPQLSDAVLADGLVKMGGLGTFKLLQVEARKSVDVNTGEAIVINGYNKVTFLPEAGVKERINAPFADLPTMVVGEDGVPVVPETTEPTQPETNTAEVDPLARLSAQADEIMDLVADINGPAPVVSVEEAVETVEPESPEVPEIPEIPETPEVPESPESPEIPESPVAEVAAVVSEPAPVPTATPTAVPTAAPTATPASVPTSVAAPAPAPTPVFTPAAEKKSDFSWLKAAILAVVIFMAIAAVAIALLMKSVDKWIEDYRQEKKELREERLKNDVVTQDENTVVVERVNPAAPADEADTSVELESSATPEIPSAPVAQETQATPAASATPVVPTEPVEEKIDFTAPRDYKKIGTKFTVTLKPGETLAGLSRKYFGAYYFWVYIYEANRDRYPNANDISKGSKLRIPKMPKGYVDAYDKEARDYAKSLELQYK